MAWFKKKPDPLSDRARALADEIARLEAQIKQLDSSLRQEPSGASSVLTQRNGGGGLTSAACPTTAVPAVPPARNSSPPPEEPIFEKISVNPLAAPTETTNSRNHYNDLGVRKYDLPAFLKRFRNHFRGPSASNPKLVSYLAAGGIQGLRPLRYEKRVARHRFFALVIGLFFMLLGLIWTYIRQSR